MICYHGEKVEYSIIFLTIHQINAVHMRLKWNNPYLSSAISAIRVLFKIRLNDMIGWISDNWNQLINEMVKNYIWCRGTGIAPPFIMMRDLWREVSLMFSVVKITLHHDVTIDDVAQSTRRYGDTITFTWVILSSRPPIIPMQIDVWQQYVCIDLHT